MRRNSFIFGDIKLILFHKSDPNGFSAVIMSVGSNQTENKIKLYKLIIQPVKLNFLIEHVKIDYSST